MRPGFQSATHTLEGFTLDPVRLDFGAKTYPALDLGGGVEVHTTKRTVLRFDAGDTLLFVGSRTYNSNGTRVSVSGGLSNSFQFGTSFGWRF